jgi:cytochrome c oxidase subunit 2
MRLKKLRFLLILTAVLCCIPATRFYEVDLPIFRLLKSQNRVHPLALHLSGEFVESNLGTAREADGSVTVRMIAQQYLFVPHCILVPAGVPIRLRVTSADVVHSLGFSDSNYAVKVVPGNVSQARLEFPHAGEYKMPCREFCGAGHYAMRSRLLVVSRDQFPNLQPDERGNCATR